MKNFWRFIIITFFPISLYSFLILKKEKTKLYHYSIAKLIFADALSYVMILIAPFMAQGKEGVAMFVLFSSYTALGVYIFKKISEEKVETDIKNLVTEQNFTYGEISDKDNRQFYTSQFKILENYEETGEVFEFEYMGEKDSYYRKREVTIQDVYTKNGYTYIEAYDLNDGVVKTFREDRMLF